MTKSNQRINYQFPRGITPLEVEQLLLDHQNQIFGTDTETFVSTNYRRDVLSDVWASIALGTIFRNNPNAIARVWGASDKSKLDIKKFSSSPPGLTTIALAKKVRMDGEKEQIKRRKIREWLEEDQKGYPKGKTLRGDSRILLELDNNRSKKLTELSYSQLDIDHNVFRQVILEMRKELEFWLKPINYRGYRIDYVDHVSELAEYVKEIFDNAYKHGRHDESLTIGSKTSHLRFLRIRKFVVDKSFQMQLDRLRGHDPSLAKHIERTTKNKKNKAFIEVCISDFGLGIVDYFLSQRQNKQYVDTSREALLRNLLYDNLSSNTLDPAAGLGIQKALEAAKNIGAYVSLRTGEFWQTKSYARKNTSLELENRQTNELSKVAGTHWQFIWAPPV